MAKQVIGGRFGDDILDETTSISTFLERLNYLAQKENQQEDDTQDEEPLQLEKVCLSVYKRGEDKHEDDLIANFIAKASLRSARLPPVSTNDHHHGDKEALKKSVSKDEDDYHKEKLITNMFSHLGLSTMGLTWIDTNEEDDDHGDKAQEFSYFSYDKSNKEAFKKNISKIEEPKLSKDDHGEKTQGFSYRLYDDVIICKEEPCIASMKSISKIAAYV